MVCHSELWSPLSAAVFLRWRCQLESCSSNRWMYRPKNGSKADWSCCYNCATAGFYSQNWMGTSAFLVGSFEEMIVEGMTSNFCEGLVAKIWMDGAEKWLEKQGAVQPCFSRLIFKLFFCFFFFENPRTLNQLNFLVWTSNYMPFAPMCSWRWAQCPDINKISEISAKQK